MADSNIARIVLDRPDSRNAQDKALLYELNDAFDRASQDDDVKVIILAAEGPDFSSGHDLRDVETPMSGFRTVGCWGGFELPGAEGYFALEEELYMGLAWRWRNIPKPTIAEVQGRVIAGGLLLVWPCDLIVASEDASFSDPVVAFGVNGVEFFSHVWELGARRAKHLLFTGAAMSASEAHAIGMVADVVPADELSEATLEMARAIAAQPSIGLKLAKLSVNQSQEAQGLWSAIQSAFSLHHVGHSHNMQRFGLLGDPEGADVIRRLSKRPVRVASSEA